MALNETTFGVVALSVTVQVAVASAATADAAIVYPVGKPPCSAEATLVQLVTATPLVAFALRAA